MLEKLNTYNTVIIGGGQAGLVMGYYLKKRKDMFLILDAHEEVGDAWKNRYDSLVLFTPRSHSALPGLKFKGKQSGYPTKDEMAEYLKKYQRKFELPIALNSDVVDVRKENNLFKLTTMSNEEYICKNLIIATGPFQDPFIPRISESLSNDVLQCHTSEYKNPFQLMDGHTLVVGGGNSGMQIACELVKAGKEVSLSIGKKQPMFPYTILNKSIFWWLSKLGVMNFSINSKIGQKIKENDPIIIGRESKSLIKNKIKVYPRTIKCKKNTVFFEDGKSIQPNNIIWATGFKHDYSWLNVNEKSLFDQNGYPIQKRGVTMVKGLYFIGLSWQHTRGSALLLGVGKDAKYLATKIY